jgi:hypothetical protein
MDIIVIQEVQLKDIGSGFKQIRKTFNSNIIPRKGDYISDILWEEPDKYEVTQVIINYQEAHVQVWVQPIRLETNDKEALEKYNEKAKSYKWECDFLFIENS